jgi:hypothetical protein
MTPISANFDREEFDCHDGTPVPPEYAQDPTRLPLLVDQCLQPLRDRLQRRIRIVSGYRSPAHNTAVGGASASQHMEMRAADIEVEGMAPSDVHAVILDMVATGSIYLGGLGLYTGWVHVDVRARPDDGHLARWTGPGVPTLTSVAVVGLPKDPCDGGMC